MAIAELESTVLVAIVNEAPGGSWKRLRWIHFADSVLAARWRITNFDPKMPVNASLAKPTCEPRQKSRSQRFANNQPIEFIRIL